MEKNISRYLLAGLLLLLLLSILTKGFYFLDFFHSPKKLAQKTLNFINGNFLQGKSKASLIDIKKEADRLYRLRFKINGNEAEIYVSEDGKSFFVQKIPMTETQETEEAKKPQEIPKKEKSEAKLFVMSYCPYGNQAEEVMKPVFDLLGNKADIKVHYIVSKDENGNFISLHGNQELNQDLREICTQEYQPEKFWDFVLAINKKTDFENSDQKWEEVAKEVGVDAIKIKNCQEKEGVSLLEREIELTQKYKISASPTLVINGIISDARRTPEGFKEAICSGFKTPPEECSKKLEHTSTSPQGGC